MLQQYSMNFHGCNIQAGYICGAATLTPYRGDGCMTELMSQALRQSYKRGDVVCTLIPANDGLYRFYENLGFSPAFHINLERYSSAHTFTHSGQYTATDSSSTDGAYTPVSGDDDATPLLHTALTRTVAAHTQGHLYRRRLRIHIVGCRWKRCSHCILPYRSTTLQYASLTFWHETPTPDSAPSR